MKFGNWKLSFQETESPLLCEDSGALYGVEGLFAEFRIRFTDDAGKTGILYKTEVLEVDEGEAMGWHSPNQEEFDLVDYDGDLDAEAVYDQAPRIPDELYAQVKATLQEIEVLGEDEGEFLTEKVVRINGAYELRSYNGGRRGAYQSNRKAWATEPSARKLQDLTPVEAAQKLAEWGVIELPEQINDEGELVELSEEEAVELLEKVKT